MAILTRRDFVKAAGAAATLPMLGSRAFAQDKLKVGFIFLGVPVARPHFVNQIGRDAISFY